MRGILKNGKKKAMKFLSILMVAALLSPLFSTGGIGQVQAAGKRKVKSITVTKPATSTLTLKRGGTYQLKVNVLPKNASNKKLKYQSKKKNVVSVSSKGRLTARKNGKAVINVTATDGSKKSASITVNVVQKLTKVKKVTLNRNKATLYVGGTNNERRLTLKPTLSPKNATTKKVNYTSSKKSVAAVSNKGVVTAKKAGNTTITAYAADGWGKKATCKVTVKKKTTPAVTATPVVTNTPVVTTTQPPVVTDVPATSKPGETQEPTTKPTENPSNTPVPYTTRTPAPTPEPPTGKELPTTDFTLVSEDGDVPNIYLDAGGEDYEGLKLVAESFAGDVELVAGATPEITDLPADLSSLRGEIVVAGSIGNNALIDKWIREQKIYVGAVRMFYETYTVISVENPEEGIDKALVIVGSDKRGTIYGIYHISEMMGVSPWVYWGDALPKEQDEVYFTKEEINCNSKEPSVRYRGIFLNDEAPSLTGWLQNKNLVSNGGANEEFYGKVYELILRCKGNYLWPAMWSYIFSENGKSETIANAKLADVYGIVMGTSHHEPLMRAGAEWGKVKSNYGGGDWNYYTNETALRKFWDDAVKRNGRFENLITLGMRGENDSSMLPDGSTVQENVDFLKKVITDQKEILSNNGLQEAPKVITLYKEVEEFWHGGSNVSGLKDWDVLNDVTIMLTEDNFGNLRTLPTDANRDRGYGWGMYYHFDYHGGPISYEWINTSPLEKTWEQMSMAYDYGVDQVWIVNVGDLKPMEMGISYFLDLAYDFDKWGTNGLNKTKEYAEQWVDQQFGEGVDEEGVTDLTSLIRDYLQMNGNRKPEAMKSEIYNVVNYNEAQEVLQKAKDIIELADEYKEKIPDKFQAAYYQLVYYPAVATANLNKMWIYQGLNELYARQGRTAANTYAALVKQALQTDTDLQNTYNNNMPGVGDKWKGMMSSKHIGFDDWSGSRITLPTPQYVTPKEGSVMLVAPKGSDKVYESGECSLPDFTNVNQDQHYIDVANAGGKRFAYEAEVEASKDWIVLDKVEGTVVTQDTIGVSIDWSQVDGTQEGVITIKGAGSEVTVKVKAVSTDVSGLDDMTFVEAHGVVSMEANHFSNKVAGGLGSEWKVIDDYGRTDSSVKTFPTRPMDGIHPEEEDVPYLEYKVYVNQAGEYTLQTYTAPSNNVDWNNVALRYEVAVGDEEPQQVNTLKSDFSAGAWTGPWQQNVLNNARTATSTHTLEQGVNTIRIYTVDRPLVLQKLVLYRTADGLKSSYLGPWESYYVGKEVESKLTVDVLENEVIVPGEIEAACHDEDFNANPEDGLTVNEGDSYTYSIHVANTQTYKVRAYGEGTGEISLTLVDEKNQETAVGNVEFSEDEITPLPLLEIKQGRAKLKVTGVSGMVKLDRIVISLIDTTLGEPLYIKSSSTQEGNLPEMAFDLDESTSWKPRNDEDGSWLEFDFDNKYFFDSFILNERGKNVSGFTIEIFNAGKWTTAYTGTEIAKEQKIQLTNKMEGYKVRITFTDVTGVPEINEVNFLPYQSEGGKPVTVTSVNNFATVTKEATTQINGGTAGTSLLDDVARTSVNGVKEIVVNLKNKEKVDKIELRSDVTDYQYYYMSGSDWILLKEADIDQMETNEGVYVLLPKGVETDKIKVATKGGQEAAVSQIFIWKELPKPEIPNIKVLFSEDFESNTTGSIGAWANSSVEASSAEAYEGNYSLRVYNRATSPWRGASFNVMNILGADDPNQEYVFSCWIKSAGDTQDMRMWICNTAGDDQWGGDTIKVSGEWTYFEQRFKMSTNQYQNAKIHGDDKGTEYFMDNMMIYKEVEGCTCHLTRPYLRNNSEILISSDKNEREVTLVGVANKDSCEVEGHQNAEVEYAYDVMDDEKGISSLVGDKLTVSGEGEIKLRIKASVNGQKRFYVQTLTVKKSDQVISEYDDWAKTENGGVTVKNEEGKYAYVTFEGLKEIDEISVNLAKDAVKTLSYMKNGEWVAITQAAGADADFKVKLNKTVVTVGVRLDLDGAKVTNWNNVSISAKGENSDLSEGCICQLGTPTILTASNVPIVPGDAKEVELESDAFAYNRGCKEEGHKDNDVEYTYEIVSGSVATISGNVLTFNDQGKVVVEVTASLAGLAKKSRKEFVAAMVGYENWALSSKGSNATSSKAENIEEGGTVTAVTDGERAYTNGQRWRTQELPAWIEIDFGQMRNVDRINIFGQQENQPYVDPTKTMTTPFTITHFTLQYLDGSTWKTFEGGEVGANDKVWFELLLSNPVRTSKIRLNISADHRDGQNSTWARVIEFEAWGSVD